MPIVDTQVLAAQKWLNSHYSSNSQWHVLTEDGQTGWGTIYGLTRALQIELGITTLSDNFGATTSAQFTAQVGSISATTSKINIRTIGQYALWCKGYKGGYTVGYFDTDTASGIQYLSLDMGLPAASAISLKMLKGLLTMDAYSLLPGGTAAKQAVQRWLNGKYVGRADFPLLPCDGLFSRNAQQGLMYAIQYEAGMADGVANGNFGPGTKSALQTQATVSLGSVDSTKNWVRLFQAALRFNDYECSFLGTFDSDTKSKTLTFQGYAALTASGIGDYRTWASLLISTGDETRPGIASDMATQLTAAHCTLLYNNGYRTVGRYLSGSLDKRYAPGELSRIFAAGLFTFPIMQEANTSASDFSYAKGKDHGFQALRRLRQLGFVAGATVFFAVDFDAIDDVITTNVIPYFQGVRDYIHSTRVDYKVGVYGTRNVCARIINAGLAGESFIASMSWGWSGNLGYRLPPSWSYDQIQLLTLSSGSLATAVQIDKDVQSSTAQPVSSAGVLPTPIITGLGSTQSFDEDYYWFLTEQCVLAENAEKISVYANGLANQYVLHRMQREGYWSPTIQGGTSSGGALWNAYTVLPEYVPGANPTVANGISLGRGAYESVASSPPASSLSRISHWAASTMAYMSWGVPATGAVGQTSTGGASNLTADLGAWALDLAQKWKYFYDNVRPTFSGSVRTYFANAIGSPSDAQFGSEDLIADADAFICAKRISANPQRPVSDVVREIETGVIPRFSTFINERFGSRANIVSAVKFVFTTNNIMIHTPAEVFGGSVFPQGTELDGVAQGFADALYARV